MTLISDENDVDRRHVEVLSVSDHVTIAGPARHPHPVTRGAALAAEVHDRLGAVPA
jgi:hypothetical protein